MSTTDPPTDKPMPDKPTPDNPTPDTPTPDTPTRDAAIPGDTKTDDVLTADTPTQAIAALDTPGPGSDGASAARQGLPAPIWIGILTFGILALLAIVGRNAFTP